MVFVVILIVISLLGLALFPVGYSFWKLLRNKSSYKSWSLTILLLLLGCWLGFNMANMERLNASATRKYWGYPLSYVTFVWEEDRWTDFVLPVPIGITIVAFDFCLGAGIFTAPLALFLWKSKGKRNEMPKNSHQQRIN